MLCSCCNSPIPQERLDILPETLTCVKCSRVQKYVGANVFTHKTAPTLVFFRGEDKENLRQLSNLVMRRRN